MIELGRTILSDDIKEQFFVCNLEKCKGACCVEGDLGAPLEEDELPILEEIYSKVKPYLSEAGVKAIEEQGTYILDEDKENIIGMGHVLVGSNVIKNTKTGRVAIVYESAK